MNIDEIKSDIKKEEQLCVKHHDKLNKLRIELQQTCPHPADKVMVSTGHIDDDSDWRSGEALCAECGLHGYHKWVDEYDDNYILLENIKYPMRKKLADYQIKQNEILNNHGGRLTAEAWKEIKELKM